MAAVSLPTSLRDVEEWLRAQEKKDLLRFVTIGSVDDGKSTLIGRLLHDAHGLYQDQLDAVRRASLKGSTRGAGSSSEIDFSLFTDGLLAEREQGITIDVAYRYFATEARKFIIADTPGHVQYTRNMATGASTATAALILVDARLGVLAQTRRHAQIAALLGIPHVIACVNKMDLVGFDRSRFDVIAKELGAIATQLKLQKIHAIPVSALLGDNVVAKSESMRAWWSGGTLLDLLETIDVGSPASPSASFRFPVQLVLRPGLGYRAFAGSIVSGSIATGDEVLVHPSGKRTRVVGVDVAGENVGRAAAPMSIALRLADEIDVSRGDLILHAEDSIEVGTKIEADVVWMSERPLEPSRTYLVKHTTRTVRATLQPIHGTDPETLTPRPTDKVQLNDVARIQLDARAPLFFDPYASNRATGSFIVIDRVTNDTVAAGMIIGKSTPLRRGTQQARVVVTDEERHARLGQRGLIVHVEAPTITRARAIAEIIERELFDVDRVAAIVEADAAASACAAAGVIALLPTAGSHPQREVIFLDDTELTVESAAAFIKAHAEAY